MRDGGLLVGWRGVTRWFSWLGGGLLRSYVGGLTSRPSVRFDFRGGLG